MDKLKLSPIRMVIGASVLILVSVLIVLSVLYVDCHLRQPVIYIVPISFIILIGTLKWAHYFVIGPADSLGRYYER